MNHNRNPFLLVSDWTQPWTGKGRKIHCYTVFMKQLHKLLQDRGLKAELSTTAITLAFPLTQTQSISYALRLQGHAVYPTQDYSIWPYFRPKPAHWECWFLRVDSSHRKDGYNIKDGHTPKDVFDFVCRLFEEKINDLPIP